MGKGRIRTSLAVRTKTCGKLQHVGSLDNELPPPSGQGTELHEVLCETPRAVGWTYEVKN